MEEERLKKLGTYIRMLREAAGMSQDELAKKSGFAGRAAISAIEKGKNNISVDRLPSLASALNTTPGTLMDILVDVETQTDYSSLIAGLTPESIVKLRSYADYLRSSQNQET